MNTIRIYRLFTSTVYRIIALFILPIIALGLGLLTEVTIHASIMAGFVVLVLYVEVIGDTWVFNGIYCKNTLCLDYLKSSKSGLDLLVKAVFFDSARRFIWIFGLNACYVLFTFIFSPVFFSKDILILGCLVALCEYTFSQIGIWICRYIDSFQIIMLITTGIAMLSQAIVSFGTMWSLYITTGILAALAVVVTIAMSLFAKKKVEDSYYDERH